MNSHWGRRGFYPGREKPRGSSSRSLHPLGALQPGGITDPEGPIHLHGQVLGQARRLTVAGALRLRCRVPRRSEILRPRFRSTPLRAPGLPQVPSSSKPLRTLHLPDLQDPSRPKTSDSLRLEVSEETPTSPPRPKEPRPRGCGLPKKPPDSEEPGRFPSNPHPKIHGLPVSIPGSTRSGDLARTAPCGSAPPRNAVCPPGLPLGFLAYRFGSPRSDRRERRARLRPDQAQGLSNFRGLNFVFARRRFLGVLATIALPQTPTAATDLDPEQRALHFLSSS